ncbi:MAG: phosphate signaling complex protein PhoU [Lachnospiraceae bacterium]|nr:phosphate signaling complex protein PhoU [Lachnospiraceae bacterium]
MRSRFDKQLELLNEEIMQMANMVQSAIQRAIEALLKQDIALAETIIEGDTEVDRIQKEIESLCFTLLMQQQPVASDLRVISAAMRMVTDMERIGDHAADISEMVTMLATEPYIQNLESIRRMASETVYMLIQSIEAYVEKNMEKAKAVIVHDDIVDDLFASTKQELTELIHQDKNNGEQATDLLMVAKYFERIGDHATNIAEHIVFAFDRSR